MNFPGRATSKKRKPITVPLVFLYCSGPLDGAEQVIDFCEDELDRITGSLNADFETANYRHVYKSLLKYTPETVVYQMNHIRTERLPK